MRVFCMKKENQFEFGKTVQDLLIFLALASCISTFSENAPAQEWPYYGGDAGGAKYSPLTQINRQNVKALRVAWTYHTGDLSTGDAYDRPVRSAFECTPLVVDGVMYITTPFARVIALEA